MTTIKAVLFLITILLVWVGSAFLHIDIPFTDLSIWGWHFYLLATLLRFAPNNAMQRWGRSFWLWTDQGVNVFHLGNEDVTVSSKVGHLQESGSKTASAMAVVINFVWYLATGQKNHCQVSIERDEEHY